MIFFSATFAAFSIGKSNEINPLFFFDQQTNFKFFPFSFFFGCSDKRWSNLNYINDLIIYLYIRKNVGRENNVAAVICITQNALVIKEY